MRPISRQWARHSWCTGHTSSRSIGKKFCEGREREQAGAQHGLKDMKSVQERTKLQPATRSVCAELCGLAVTSTGPVESNIRVKDWLCLPLHKHPLPPSLPAAGLCRAVCISPAGTHFQSFPPISHCCSSTMLPWYLPSIPSAASFLLLVTLAQCSNLILLWRS